MEAQRRILDDLSKLATSAAGVVQGAGQEVEQMFRQRFERFIDSLDLVTREEFDAVKAMAEAARRENEALEKRIKDLEAGKAKAAATGKTSTATAKTKTKAAASRAKAPKTAAKSRQSKSGSGKSAAKKSAARKPKSSAKS